MTDFALAIVVLAAGAGTRMCSAIPEAAASGGRPLPARPCARLARRPLRSDSRWSPGRASSAVAGEVARSPPGRRWSSRRSGLARAMPCAAPRRRSTASSARCSCSTPTRRCCAPRRSRGCARRWRAAGQEGAAVGVLGFEPADPGGYGRLILRRGGGARPHRRGEGRHGRGTGGAPVQFRGDGVSMARRRAPGSRAVQRQRQGRVLPDGPRGGGAERPANAAAVALCPEEETLGVNDRLDLAAAEARSSAGRGRRRWRRRATLVAPETVFLSHDTVLGRDVTDRTECGVRAGVTVEDGAEIGAFSWLEGCVVRAGAAVGPYARLRPGAEIGPGARVGNFVEVKNATLGPGAKANHLSYLGDATVGRAPTSAPGPSPATMTASASTAPRSARRSSSAPTRRWWRRWRWGRGPMSPPARPSPPTWRPARWRWRGRGRWRSRATRRG
jgi:bifunctional UDP-N-acetylglucosamine pyrophosphorylase/glucosamine-1-phosphate N-acetyltransferase